MSRGVHFRSTIFRIAAGQTFPRAFTRQNIYPLVKHSTPVLNRFDWERNGCYEFSIVRCCSSKAAPDDNAVKPSLFQRFKTMYRDYWYVLLPVHVVTSCGWFGGFYYLAKSGVDLAAFAETMNFSESLVDKLRSGGHNTTGYLAISYALYKIATPLRYTVTLGGTTLSINYLKEWGYIKPMPKREELKKIFNDKRESFIERKSNMAHNLAKAKMKLVDRKIFIKPAKKKTEVLRQTVIPSTKSTATEKPVDQRK